MGVAVQLELDVWRKVKCHLHLSQAVEGEEGMSPDACDAVALGDLTVTQRRQIPNSKLLLKCLRSS